MTDTKHASSWKASIGVAGLVVLLAALIAGNVILSNVRLRLDMTEDNLYSLSEGTRNVLKGLEQNVTLKLFVSSSSAEMPVHLKNYAKQIEDLLQEYRIKAGKRLTIEKYDPQPDSDAEEWAQNYGLQGQQMGLFSPPLYLGLVAVSGANEGVLPNLDPRNEQLLEYEITRLIYRTVHPEKPVIGVMSSLPIMGTDPGGYMMPQQQMSQPPWLAFRDLKEDYTVREVPTSATEIDPDIVALVVVHPKNLSDTTMFAIDQFVLRGGQLLAFVDPLNLTELESAPQTQFQRPNISSSLDPLFKAWGIGYESEKVLADPSAVSRLRGQNNQIEDSLVWLSLRKKHVAEDVLTSQLEYLMMPMTGGFTDNTADDLTYTSLITAAEGSGLVNSMMAQFGGKAVRRDLKASPSSLSIAIRLAGTFKTAFPNGKPEPEKDSDSENNSNVVSSGSTPFLSEGKSAAILVADVDFLFDRFCVEEMNFFGTKAYRPLNDNINFFANAVESVAGGADLSSIRSRGKFHRPFQRVLDLEQNARAEWQAKEDDLEEKLRQTQQQLSMLQTKKDESQKFILSNEQKEAIEKFRKDERALKGDLKKVRKNLRRDIERLGVKVKIINIVLMPTLVGLLGISFGIYRRNRQ
ncbi:MAG: Gldg family protein [Lentisphaerae bacterium]|nr:Gldg family protein [Lentisphaerota bacterium]